MGAVSSLPVGYKEIYTVNLQKDKKAAILINALALLIVVVMVITANFFVPLSSFFNMDAGLLKYSIRFLSLMIAIAGYVVLHEFIHGIVMMICGTKKVRYGFTGMYFFAGSDDYYDKRSYIAIALAPIVIFLFVLIPINLMVPYDWFWFVYFLEICNIAGGVGDLFVSIRFSNMPKDILIKDNGVNMAVYSRQSDVEETSI